VADPTATPGVTAGEKSPDAIERDMEQTRESITQKVAALENQVLGTIQTASNTISDTVQTVKDTVSTAPAAVKETVQETVAAVKDSVKETFTSVKESVAAFSLTDCVREHPGAALGTSAVVGFLTGFLLLGGRDSRPLMARGYREPAPGGRPGTAPPDTAHHFSGYAAHTEPARPGMFAGLLGMVSGEVEQLAKQALSTALASLKQSVNEKVPRMMDDAVQTLADRVTGHGPANGVGAADARVTPTAGF
jgi:ElaB/YqjD/DUF883 family membrane-anchored ribosome-binding protein